jgi:hypothetical protein
LIDDCVGSACFICCEDNNIADVGTADCPQCPGSVKLDLSQGQRVLEHMGAHILHEPSIIHSAMTLCGLCLRPAAQCQIFLKKGKGAHASLTVNHESSKGCLVKIKYSYRVASESTASSPCSNVPLQCPLCPKANPAVWRYFMKIHFLEKHKNATLSKYEHLWKLTNFEISEMRKIWAKRKSTTVKRTKKAKSAHLIVSEDHRAQIPSKYVNRFSHQDSRTYCLTSVFRSQMQAKLLLSQVFKILNSSPSLTTMPN